MDYICSLLTFGLLIFAGFQWAIQKKAHTLNLFDRRWQAFKDLQNICEEAKNFEHVYYQDNPSPDKNYLTMYNKLSLFAEECEILFDKDIAQIGKETAEAFMIGHRTIDELDDWKKYHEESPERYTDEEKKRLCNVQISTFPKMFELFGVWYEKLLKFIKDERVV